MFTPNAAHKSKHFTRIDLCNPYSKCSCYYYVMAVLQMATLRPRVITNLPKV